MNPSTNKRPKLYIGCSLTHAPAEFISAVETLKHQLRQDYEVLDFVGLTKGTPADVYHTGVHKRVSECDLLVSICDYPAIGLGYEMAVAVEQYHKPVLAVARKGAAISRLLPGIDAPGYSFERYHELNEVKELIANKLTRLN